MNGIKRILKIINLPSRKRIGCGSTLMSSSNNGGSTKDFALSMLAMLARTVTVN